MCSERSSDKPRQEREKQRDVRAADKEGKKDKSDWEIGGKLRQMS